MNNKKEEVSAETVARETAEYCINIIPSLVDSLVKVNRETEIAALTITGTIRDMIWNRDKLEKGFSFSDLLISLQFQDVTRQETERVISSLITLKEKLEALKNQMSDSSGLSSQREDGKAANVGTSEDSAEPVLLF